MPGKRATTMQGRNSKLNAHDQYLPGDTEKKGSSRHSSGLQPIEEQIRRWVERNLRSVLDTVSFDKPAQIERVNFRRTSVAIKIQWPFWVPPPGGDYMASTQDIRRFKRGLRAHLCGEQLGKRLSNLLHQELIDFTANFLGVHRFGPKMVASLRSLGERRFGGRPHNDPISAAHARRIRREGGIIRKAIEEMRSTIKISKKQDTALRQQLKSDFDRDRYSWMRSFFPVFGTLQGKPSLRQLDRWSSIGFTAAILQKEIYRDTGRHYSLRDIEGDLRKL
jgi:hypothetical protein